MSEIVRLRAIRSPQRKLLQDERGIPLYPDGLSDFAVNLLTPGAVGRSNIPATFLELHGLTSHATDLSSPAVDLDEWLVRKGNRPRLHDLREFLALTADEGSPPIEQWLKHMQAERHRLADLLLASVFAPCQPQLRVRLTRLLTVIALIELLRNMPKRVSDAGEIYEALAHRVILLPRELWTLMSSPELRRMRPLREGFSDLYLVREEWVRYELGEIAHIENVRDGELKERRLARLSEREDTLTTDVETSTLDERSTESTDRFELTDEASRESQLSLSAELGVDTSGQYGPTQVDTHVGGSLDYSVAESSRRTSTQIRESVSRAVTRVEKRVRQLRVARTLVRTESSDLHSLKNESGADRASVYRWVEKIKRVQIFRYANRYLLEFEVPEPGAWWRWMMAQPGTQGTTTPKPVPLTLNGQEATLSNLPLQPNQIDVSNYLTLGARYYALGLEPPPSNVRLAFQLNSNSDSGGTNREVFVTGTSSKIPDGYIASTWEATLVMSIRDNQGAGNPTPPSVTLSVGAAPPVGGALYASSGGSGSDNANVEPIYLQGNVGNINTDVVPALAAGNMTDSFNAIITINCTPSDDRLTTWKISTYEKIASAYAELQRRYDEERRTLDGAMPSLADRFAPGRNQEIVKQELKKHVISLLTGVDMNGREALTIDEAYSNQPFIDMEAAERVGPEVQFIEQAFEWSNISFVLYPYFWTARGRWPQIAALDGADPDFVRFLTAGSARVVVPARPGFESQVQLYSALGVLWGGGPVPAPDNADYLSVAEEIKSMQRAPDDGEPGESWDVRLPTSLVCLSTADSLPENGAITLDPPPGRTLP